MKLDRVGDPTKLWFVAAGIGLGLFVLLGIFLLVGGPADKAMTEADRTWGISTTTCLASNGLDFDPLSTADLESVIAQRDELGIGSFAHDCGRWTTIEGD